MTEITPQYIAGGLDGNGTFREKSRYGDGLSWCERSLWLACANHGHAQAIASVWGGTVRTRAGVWRVEFYRRDEILAVLTAARPFLIGTADIAGRWIVELQITAVAERKRERKHITE